MKIKSTVATLSLLSLISFGALAATQIDMQQAQGRQSIGTITVSSVTSSPMDMREMLDQKAQEKGASAYRVIEARTGDQWHATAELYK